VKWKLIENSESNFKIFPYPLELIPSAAVHSTKSVSSLDNKRISDNVRWAKFSFCLGFVATNPSRTAHRRYILPRTQHLPTMWQWWWLKYCLSDLCAIRCEQSADFLVSVALYITFPTRTFSWCLLPTVSPLCCPTHIFHTKLQANNSKHVLDSDRSKQISTHSCHLTRFNQPYWFYEM